jgi:hypothetical protein
MKTDAVSSYVEHYADLFRQIKFRESHYKIVGEITVNFSAIEYFLTTLVARLINPDEPLAAALALKKLNLRSTIDISRAVFLLREHDPAEQTTFLAIIDSIENLRSKRNDIIHSMWDYDYANKRIGFNDITIHKKKVLRIRNKSFTLEDLENLSREVTAALNQLMIFIRDWPLKQQPNNA